mmetsp:Transcript_2314/g.3366  ORF Transcript_2314/g.3366 Transcript_2314/m.3366 type:complete len:434 (+) Transcript_2314:80-1381(+)
MVQSIARPTKERKHPRDWIEKLLRKHAESNGQKDQNITENDNNNKIQALTVAPMVDQSDLPFRLLCRKYGANLAYTPMIHARMFCDRVAYRKQFFNLQDGTPAQDRPLIAQLCGSNPEYMLKAAKWLEPHVDGIDINCGCPQGIAKRGHYGAFLLEDKQNLIRLVEALSESLDVPLSVKVRLLPDGIEESLALYQRLVDAGASMLCIHGRTRFQKAHFTGKADWEAIHQAVLKLGHVVPILANGSISNMDEVRACLEVTQADGVMVSEAILEYPPLFCESQTESVDHKRIGFGRVELARQYLELCKEYPPNKHGQGTGIKCIRMHMHKMLHEDLQKYTNIRTLVSAAESLDQLHAHLDQIQQLHDQEGHTVEDERMSWYMRHRTKKHANTDDNNDDGSLYEAEGGEKAESNYQLDDDNAGCMSAMFGNDDDEW